MDLLYDFTYIHKEDSLATATIDTVVLDDLIKRQALDQTVSKFREVFPNGMTVTRENLLTAGRTGIEPRWLATILLNPDQISTYTVLEKVIYAEYLNHSNQNWADLRNTRTEAYEKYLAQPSADPSDYQKTMDEAVKAFQKKDDDLWSDYQGSKSVELAEILGL